MKFRIYWSLAKGVLLESIRRKDLWVIAILGFLVLAGSSALGFFGVAGLEIFIKDLAVTVLGLFSTIIAVVTSTRVLPEEIKNRTLYPLLARPISRFDLVIGKFLGAVLVTWTGFFMLALTTGLAMLIFKIQFEPIMLQYLLGKMMGLALVCAIGLGLSVYMTPPAATTMGFVLTMGASSISRAMVLAYTAAPAFVQWLFKGINLLLPQVHLFDFGSRTVYYNWSPVPLWAIGTLFAYLVVYGGVMLLLAHAKLRRQTL
jgi:ABC-type transport system involved in multi-copper enzyme maturation permease subunit